MGNYLRRKRYLNTFWEAKAQKEVTIDKFIRSIESLHWKSLHDIKHDYPKVSILKNNRLVFDLKGNKYRLIVSYLFYEDNCYLFVEWIGTHAEYTKICNKNIQHTIQNYSDYS